VIEFRYTSHQVARGARPDAVSGNKWYLIKNPSLLRLTYQIRLLTFMAQERRTRLIIVVPKTTSLSSDLKEHIRANREAVKVERAN
jgi:hypothetical protein